MLGGLWDCSALEEQITKPGQAAGAGGRFPSLEEKGMEKGWGIPRGESIPLWARQRDSCPPVSPCALWYPVPAMGSVWHKGTLLPPQPPRPWPGPVLWPGQECPWGTALSSQPSCAHLGVLHPFPHPHPGWGWKWGISGLCAHSAPSSPNFREAF